jgi:carbamoyltransferase
MTAILGISAFYHDSAAALIVDGEIIAAAQEERFSRKKHDESFPSKAVDYCLNEAGFTPKQLDFVGFYDKPLLKFERLLETYISFAPIGFKSFLTSIPSWLKQKLHLPREMRKALNCKSDDAYTKRFVFCDHHESHAASAFFPSPFDQAAILTLDGVGEWATATIGTGINNKIELTHEMRFPHSLGLLYSAFTYFTGFKVNSGEYKLMGLAPYGQPKYATLIRDNLIDLKPDGSFRMDMRYFNYCQGLTMTNSRLEKLLGRPRRKPETELTQDDMDIAASIQAVTEDIMLRCVSHAHKITGQKNLCLAGGVALNCVGNGRIIRESPFENVWIQPAAGDAGGALGVALLTWHQLLENKRETSCSKANTPEAITQHNDSDNSPTADEPAVVRATSNPCHTDTQYASLLGPSFTTSQIQQTLDRKNAKYKTYENEDELLSSVADLMANEKVVGWFHGRMEFGPRALGARSIIGDARSSQMQATMNRKIKFRESFRPFAPCVLKENAHEYFEMSTGQESPYMLVVAPVKEDKRTQQRDNTTKTTTNTNSTNTTLNRVSEIRSVIPAVTHVDYSARVQTIDQHRHPRYYKLIRAFEQKTGCPVIINTSFNVRGEPIVCTPDDAYRCFMATDMDVLVLEDCILLKEEQPKDANVSRDAYLESFALD